MSEKYKAKRPDRNIINPSASTGSPPTRSPSLLQQMRPIQENLLSDPTPVSPSAAWNHCDPDNVLRDSPQLDQKWLDIVPRRLLMRLVDAHWRVVWPLYPILDRRSIMNDLEQRRELVDTDPVWAYMILAMVGCTIMYLPKPFLPIPGTEAKKLVKDIGDRVKQYLALPYDYEQAGLTRCESVAVALICGGCIADRFL